MLHIKSKFKKIIPATMVFAALLTVAPLSSFAAETETPVKNNVVNFPQTNYQVNDLNHSVPSDEDGEVTAQGWKKSAVVATLRGAGKGAKYVADWLDLGTKEAKYVSKNADKIADALESFEDHIQNRLIDFMIGQCGIPGGSARTIAYAICAIAL